MISATPCILQCPWAIPCEYIVDNVIADEGLNVDGFALCENNKTRVRRNAVEVASEENCNLVSKAYTRIMEDVHAEKPVSDEENFIFQIELLSQEVNSGASFEQYFRWVGKRELDQILGHVKGLDLPPVYDIVEEALAIAFPNGVPEDDDEYEECTDWSETQEEKLSELFEKFEAFNGAITNKLAKCIKEKGIS